jgi:hypothetical protein
LFLITEGAILISQAAESMALATFMINLRLSLRKTYVNDEFTDARRWVVGGGKVAPIHMITQPSFVLFKIFGATQATPAFSSDQSVLAFRLG